MPGRAALWPTGQLPLQGSASPLPSRPLPTFHYSFCRNLWNVFFTINKPQSSWVEHPLKRLRNLSSYRAQLCLCLCRPVLGSMSYQHAWRSIFCVLFHGFLGRSNFQLFLSSLGLVFLWEFWCYCHCAAVEFGVTAHELLPCLAKDCLHGRLGIYNTLYSGLRSSSVCIVGAALR